MYFLSSLNIAGSALTAERFRMNIIAQNIANQNVTRTEDGDPYRRKQVVFEERNMDFGSVLRGYSNATGQGGVRVAEVVESDKPFEMTYDPNHPDANDEGYVLLPNVNTSEEMVDFMAASRAYEANITALNVVKNMVMQALEIGK
ncbi:MAG: flagellar basal body rod protein FlgC [Clostridiales bacterium]|jgi:flagellar basal-body rod protein FlgC|nr:flagellar basal body rod protein FlgC [Clostridiales bacterium]